MRKTSISSFLNPSQQLTRRDASLEQIQINNFSKLIKQHTRLNKFIKET